MSDNESTTTFDPHYNGLIVERKVGQLSFYFNMRAALEMQHEAAQEGNVADTAYWRSVYNEVDDHMARILDGMMTELDNIIANAQRMKAQLESSTLPAAEVLPGALNSEDFYAADVVPHYIDVDRVGRLFGGHSYTDWLGNSLARFEERRTQLTLELKKAEALDHALAFAREKIAQEAERAEIKALKPDEAETFKRLPSWNSLQGRLVWHYQHGYGRVVGVRGRTSFSVDFVGADRDAEEVTASRAYHNRDSVVWLKEKTQTND